MKKFNYTDVPNLTSSVVDRANDCIVEHSKGRRSVDTPHVLSVFNAQYRVLLEVMKQRHPYEAVAWPSKEYVVIGYIPNGYTGEGLLYSIVRLRIEAKKAQNWALADTLKSIFENIGCTLEESKEGVTWWRKSDIYWSPEYAEVLQHV